MIMMMMMMMLMMICVFGIHMFEILNKFLRNAFSLVQFNNWDACVLVASVLQTVRSAHCGTWTVKSAFTRAQDPHTPQPLSNVF
jgi:hypothetical protein